MTDQATDRHPPIDDRLSLTDLASTIPSHQTLLVTSSLSWFSMALCEVICAGSIGRSSNDPTFATYVERRITLDPGRAI